MLPKEFNRREMSFKNEIEAIVGDIDSPDYTSQVALYLAEGVKFITKYVMNNFEMVEKLTSSTTLNNSPTTMATSNALKIISVTRNDGTRDSVALQVPSWKVADYTDANSIYYTSKLDPKWYISNGTLNVIPTPAAGQSALVRHITPDTSVAATDTSVDNFPAELERGIVLYASKEMLRKLMSVRNTALPSDMTIPTLPTAPALLSLSLDNLGTAPGYTQTVLNLTSAPSISALSISVSAPSAPTLNTVSYIDASNADASATAVSDVSVGSVTKATITNNLPTYIPPTISLTSAPSISDLSISASAPSAHTLSDTIICGL